MNLDQQLSFFKDYFNLSAVGPSLQEMALNALVLILMVSVLSLVYIKTARTLSNRKRLAAVFPLLSLTTMMIISVIQSSLALSLGLVGALSIVRFRSAIKEPEELTYIFLAISLGLGMGAGQQELTVGFFILVMAYLLIENFLNGRIKLLDLKTDESLYLNYSTPQLDLSLDELIKLIGPFCHYIEFKRVEQNKHTQQFLLVIKVRDYQNLSALKQKLIDFDPKADLSILNDEKLFA